MEDLSTGSFVIGGGFFQNHTVSEISPYVFTAGKVTFEDTYMGRSGVTVGDEITTLSATITAPVGGVNPDFTAISGDSDKYSAEVFNWYAKLGLPCSLTIKKKFFDILNWFTRKNTIFAAYFYMLIK